MQESQPAGFSTRRAGSKELPHRSTPGPATFGDTLIPDVERIRRLAACYREHGRPLEAAREYKRLADAESTDVLSLHRAVALESKVALVADVMATRLRLAERLAARELRLGALHHYRIILDSLEGPAAFDRSSGARVGREVERIRAYFAERREALSAYSEAAEALERSGDDQEAAELYARMLAIACDNPGFWARQAEVLCRLGRVDEALPAFRNAASALIVIDRPLDAVRVMERILHFRVEPDDARFLAELYLDRGEPKDAARAVTKLKPCFAKDPDDILALALLARAFEGMRQPSRALQVRAEMLRLSRDSGESELAREVERKLRQASTDDPVVLALLATKASVTSSAPEISYHNTYASVTDAELEDDEIEEEPADSSVLDDVAFEDLADEWVMPVITREARRALDDAKTFAQLRLFPKAEQVLVAAIADDPVCAELREALRSMLHERGDIDGFVEETLVLADLYRQRRFIDRARTLVGEALAIEPESPRARELSAILEDPAPR